MLHEIQIKNFTVISNIRVSFGKGLNILTGETGAGKSIVIDALQVLLGGKGFLEYIREGEDEAVLEGLFSLSPGFSSLKKLEDLEYLRAGEDQIIIRRVLSSHGKSKAYLNDRMIPVSFLAELSEDLLEVHGQNDQLYLFKNSVQLSLLDEFAGAGSLKKSYQNAFDTWIEGQKALQRLQTDKKNFNEKKTLLEFQREELSEAGFSPDEEEKLAREKSILSQTGLLKRHSTDAFDVLSGGDGGGGVLSGLLGAEKLVRELSQLDSSLEPAVELIKSAEIQVKEAVTILRDFRENIEADPERLDKIESRLFLISRFKKKYGISLSEIVEYRQRINDELAHLDGLGFEEEMLRETIAESEKGLMSIGGELSLARKGASLDLEKRVTRELKGLKLENARFRIAFEPFSSEEAFGRDGLESISFLVSTNPGFEPVELCKAASGGELSRIMLALKTVLSGQEKQRILVFDEIDAGVGGAVGEYIGKRLSLLSRDQQVFCITHLPQIASFAGHHFHVEKKVKNGKTGVLVRPLDLPERIQEIGRMLGGVTFTDTVIRHAEELLDKNQAGINR